MICKWTDDSHRFILEYFDIIHDSPSHVYHSGLPLSPSKSWLREHYSLELSREVRVIKGLRTEWGKCSRIVSFDHTPLALACWKKIVAVCFDSPDIIVLNVITGVRAFVLSGHIGEVGSLAFSLNGTFLVSGSYDNTIKLWDIQTGGVVKTFHGHKDRVYSVSISLDCTTIASGSWDQTTRLWNTGTGECYCVIEHNGSARFVNFSPTNPQVFMSACDDYIVQQWDINGHQIGSVYGGDCVTFSQDGTRFVSWRYDETVATVWDSDSEQVVAEIQLPGDGFQCCCLSPDGRLVAGSVGSTIYIWDITSLDPRLIETFTGHTDDITSLIFSSPFAFSSPFTFSSLISSSHDRSIKFWQVDASSTHPATTDLEPTPPTLVPIGSVGLQTTSGIAISSDSAGVLKTWDISTGLCKGSFQTPAKGYIWRDAQVMEGKLILVWLEDHKIHIWSVEKEELLQVLDVHFPHKVIDFRVSGDQSKAFILGHNSIQALSLQTGEVVGEVKLGEPLYDSLVVDGSRVWVSFEDSKTEGWDFGLSGSAPISLSNVSSDKPHLCFIGTMQQDTSPSRVEDTVTRKEVFRLSGRYAMPEVARWDSQYLIAGYTSGEVLILDFNHVFS